MPLPGAASDSLSLLIVARHSCLGPRTIPSIKTLCSTLFLLTEPGNGLPQPGPCILLLGQGLGLSHRP